ncbi:MAG: protein kinase [Deltaproteobacteria bacterium]|nr:protein kinase [Deltaproteobacteria bacterium]
MAEKGDDQRGKGGLLGWLKPGKAGEAAAPEKKPAPVHVDDDGAAETVHDVARRHEDRGEIARGGMGSIRQVFDTTLHRTVAMKVLFPEHRQNQGTLERFAEEAQIMAQLEHPNIVPVHDYGDDAEGMRWFTMYYVRGKTLTEILQTDTVADGSREAYFKLLNIFLRVCDAVMFAHSRGVVHRDLKPDNIMVGAFGEVYLMDWGIARLLGKTPAPDPDDIDGPVRVRRVRAADDEKGQIIGTFFYMSPEQAQAEIDKIDERTDVFLLGGVLYELLTGQPPYMGSSIVEVVRAAQKCRIKAPDIVAADRHIPEALSHIAMRCLAKDQADRYSSVAALKADVENFVKGGASFPTITFKAGEHLMREGEHGDQVFIINRGTVQVYKTLQDGRRHGVATLRTGAVVGEAAVLSSQERTASVVAVEDVVATAVTREQLDKELGLNNWMGPLVKALADRFVDVSRQLDESRAALHAVRIDTWVLEYLVTHGQPGEHGAREVLFSHMLKACRHALKVTEVELRRVIDGRPRLMLDVERDVIAYVPSEPTPD